MLVRIISGPLAGCVVDMSSLQAAYAVQRRFAERHSVEQPSVALAPPAPQRPRRRRRREVCA